MANLVGLVVRIFIIKLSSHLPKSGRQFLTTFGFYRDLFLRAYRAYLADANEWRGDRT